MLNWNVYLRCWLRLWPSLQYFNKSKMIWKNSVKSLMGLWTNDISYILFHFMGVTWNSLAPGRFFVGPWRTLNFHIPLGGLKFFSLLRGGNGYHDIKNILNYKASLKLYFLNYMLTCFILSQYNWRRNVPASLHFCIVYWKQAIV